MDPEETIITDEEYEEIVERLAKIGKKISILMMNYKKLTTNKTRKKQICTIKTIWISILQGEESMNMK